MRTPLIIAILTAAGVTFVTAAADLVVSEGNVASFYRDFVRLTKHPHLVAPLTGSLCRVPTSGDYEREKEATGPHYHASVHLYANPAAMKAITNRMEAFPVGSVIVKEKLIDTNRVAGIGGMIKRAPGYDVANGDWEYFYSSKQERFHLGHLRSCIECHQGAKTNDYVFSVWNLPDWKRGPTNRSTER